MRSWPPRRQFQSVTLPFREFTHLLQTGTYGYGCGDSAGLYDDHKIQNADNYIVSTQVVHGLPGAHMLTWGYDLCSALLPRLTMSYSAELMHFMYLESALYNETLRHT